MTDLDLTPKTLPAQPGRQRWRNRFLVFGLLLAGGFVCYQALTSARVFYLNVDEALEQKADLGTDQFRLQGTVIGEPAQQPNGSLLFTVGYGGAEAEVHHVGPEPSGLFQEGEKVLSEGRWQGGIFESEQILVKHSEEYIEANDDRVNYDLEDTVSGEG